MIYVPATQKRDTNVTRCARSCCWTPIFCAKQHTCACHTKPTGRQNGGVDKQTESDPVYPHTYAQAPKRKTKVAARVDEQREVSKCKEHEQK